ncbi:MAG TPA: endonuclease/exonuclease/phosphatase family protein [Anaeromyxobacter sp.]|nr:endonuclease/exonuclease/phosphatase family protein [Anaeromyxobacter sp.]
MSWNLHGLRGTDGRRDPERVARVIEDVGPDVAGLQEVGLPRESGAPDDPAQLLAGLTGLHGAFGPTMSHRLGFAYGNAVLSRAPILAVRNYDLSVAGREPRGCVRVDVELSGSRVHFFVAHLGLHWRERRRQAAQLLSADILRDAALAYPLVLVGDFNSVSNRSAVPRWLRRQLVDAAIVARNEAPTFPSRFPLLRLDHCYVGAAIDVRSVEVIRTREVRRASDHLPLVAELEVRRDARRPPAPRLVETAGVTTHGGGGRPPG